MPRRKSRRRRKRRSKSLSLSLSQEPHHSHPQNPNPNPNPNPNTMPSPSQDSDPTQIPQTLEDDQGEKPEDEQEEAESEPQPLLPAPDSGDPPAPDSGEPPAPDSGDPPAHDSGNGPPPPPRKVGGKRKKPSRKQKANVEKKLRLLRHHLCPTPFFPAKTLDLPKHENLFKTLGLWDFASLDLDCEALRPDLLALLIANYDPAGRCSYVHDHRINVSRASLARALHLPFKKDKADPGLDGAITSEEAIPVVSEFVSNYMLLHEDDAWMMPEEVMVSERLLKEGRFEKVDWAGLMWFMVERELMDAPESGSCYYAAHLQRLIRSQKPDIFKEDDVEEVSMDEDEDAGAAKIESVDDFGGDCLETQRVELSLGQENGEREHTGEENLMQFQESKEVVEGQWFLNERNIGVEHSLRHCNLNVLGNSECEQVDKEEAEEERYEQTMKFPKLERLESVELDQDMEPANVTYGLSVNAIDPSSSDFLTPRADMHKSMLLSAGGLPMFGNSCKREMDDEEETRHLSHFDHDRKGKTNGPWDHEQEGFSMCIEQAQSWLNRAVAMHEEKQEAHTRAHMNVEYLAAQLQQRDNIIHSMEKSLLEERSKRQVEAYRLERELCVMTQLIHGYKKALNETRAQFAEYRERFQQPDEPIYKDVAGNGGLVLSIMELEKQRLKKEEEERKMCIAIEEKLKAFEQDWLVKLDSYADQVDLLNKRLLKIAEEVGLLKENSKTKHVTTGSE
eukprot:TRINITY_DN1074_c0_g1_i1.p1 TRINITY_DN1074_c0_g1~~TRINITY_DN1074_c0_g1_i1.p1  ORF type:complete len:734 (+),score=174.19 TRINITY_DN1074_c0_g1_i1:147-2348(+)